MLYSLAYSALYMQTSLRLRTCPAVGRMSCLLQRVALIAKCVRRRKMNRVNYPERMPSNAPRRSSLKLKDICCKPGVSSSCTEHFRLC